MDTHNAVGPRPDKNLARWIVKSPKVVFVARVLIVMFCVLATTAGTAWATAAFGPIGLASGMLGSFYVCLGWLTGKWIQTALAAVSIGVLLMLLIIPAALAINGVAGGAAGVITGPVGLALVICIALVVGVGAGAAYAKSKTGKN